MNIVIKTSCPIWNRPNLTAIMSILLHFCHTFTGKWNDSCFKYKNCSNVLLNQCYKQATSINQLFGPNIFDWNIFDFFTNKLLSCQIHIVLAFEDPISLIKSLCTEAEAKACLLSKCFFTKYWRFQGTSRNELMSTVCNSTQRLFFTFDLDLLHLPLKQIYSYFSLTILVWLIFCIWL